MNVTRIAVFDEQYELPAFHAEVDNCLLWCNLHRVMLQNSCGDSGDVLIECF